MPYAGSDFPVATTTEKISYFFDFSPALAAGELVTSATWTTSVAPDSNVFDVNSASVVYGSSSITGNIVGQQFYNLVNGVKYLIVCTANTNQGNILVPYSHLYVDIPN